MAAFMDRRHPQVDPKLGRGRARSPRRQRTPRRLAGRVCLIGAVLLGATVLSMLPTAHLAALEAAGAFKGQAISGVAHFVSALKGNLVWLGGTAMGLIIAIVGIMFLAGHSRAHDLAIKTIIGVAILASISGIVA